MPGLTNNTTLLEAENQLIVAVNELVTAIQSINTSGITATVDLSSIVQKLEDTIGTPINPLEASLRTSLNLVRDNLDTPTGNLGIATVVESLNLPLSRTADNLEISLTDLFGTLGNFLEFFNIEIPGLLPSAGVATILSIIAIELSALQVGAPIDLPTILNNIKVSLDTIGTEIDGIGDLANLAKLDDLELIADNIEAHRVTVETQSTAAIVAQNTNFADTNAALDILQIALGYEPE